MSLGSFSHEEVVRNGPPPSQDIHPNHLSILLLTCSQPLSLPDLTDPRTTTAVRTTSNVGACPVVPPSLCGYRQGEPSPYLISPVLLGELDFRGLVTLARYEQGPSTPVTSVVPSLSFPTIYLSRAPLGRPTLTFKDNRCSGT